MEKVVSYLVQLVYGLATKSLGAKCTFKEVAKEIKCHKMNVNIFTIKLRYHTLPSSDWPSPLSHDA